MIYKQHLHRILFLAFIFEMLLCVSVLGLEYSERTVVSGNISNFEKHFTYTSAVDTSDKREDVHPTPTSTPSANAGNFYRIRLYVAELNANNEVINKRPLGGVMIVVNPLSPNPMTFTTNSDGWAVLYGVQPGDFTANIYFNPGYPLLEDFNWDGAPNSFTELVHIDHTH